MKAGVANLDDEGIAAALRGQCGVDRVGERASVVDDDGAAGGLLHDRVDEPVTFGI